MCQVFTKVWAFLGLLALGTVWGGIPDVHAQGATASPNVLSAGDSLIIKELYFKGIQQKSGGQLAAAEQTFKRLIELQPDNDAAYFELSRIYLEQEDYPLAEQAARRAAELKSENSWYWSLLLDIYRKTAEINRIPDVLTKLIELNPDEESNYHEKAYTLYLSRNFDEALEVYDTIAARFGKTDAYYLSRYQILMAKGESPQAIAALEELVAQEPEESNAYILLAERYTDSGKYSRAIELLEYAAGRFPEDPIILLSKADTYLAMGRQKKAHDYLRQAFLSEKLDIDVKAGVLYTAVSDRKQPIDEQVIAELATLLTTQYPQEAKAHAVKGDIFVRLRRFQDGRDAYRASLDINQYLDGVWQQLLQTELQLNAFDDMTVHGTEATKLFPDHPLILFFTGLGYLGKQDHASARQYLERALNNVDGGHSQVLTQIYTSLGDVYHALGMDAESDVAYEEAIALDSTNAYALNNYAYYLALRKESLELAGELSKRSNELEPGNASYEDTYAWVLFRQGNYREALVWIERAIQHAGEPSATLLEHYGDILAKSGDIDHALIQWKKALAASVSTGKDIDKLSQKIHAKQYID